MEITKERLRQIIKEEINNVMTEDPTMYLMTVENFIEVAKALVPLVGISGMGALVAQVAMMLGKDREELKKGIDDAEANKGGL